MFEGTGIPADIIAGLLTAGTYYLILHRRRSTFWGVDYQRMENRERLYAALDYLCGLVFNALEERNKTVEIALRMKKEGISDEAIVRCTDLPASVIEQL